MSDRAWDRAKEVGAHVSLSVPIEMQMRPWHAADPEGHRHGHGPVPVG